MLFRGRLRAAARSVTSTSRPAALPLAALLAIAASVIAPAAAPEYSGEIIFPLESWHKLVSIVEPNGDLLVCWFHGSGERTADDVLIRGARWSRTHRAWSEPFTMADTPGFPETNPVLFIDQRERLFFFWPLIIAHRWETALMKYRISTDYQLAAGPPVWASRQHRARSRRTSCPRRKRSSRLPAIIPSSLRQALDSSSTPRTSISREWAGSRARIRSSCRRAASSSPCTRTATRSASWRSATIAG